MSGDIQSTTQVAYQMVTAYGMSRLGMFSLSGYPDVSLIPDTLKSEMKVVVDEPAASVTLFGVFTENRLGAAIANVRLVVTAAPLVGAPVMTSG